MSDIISFFLSFWLISNLLKIFLQGPISW
jgi:hypothetical protein